MTRTPAFTAARRAKFLAHIEANAGCSVREAAAAAGVRRWQVRELLDTDAAFKAAYDASRGNRHDLIREEIWTRAMDRKDPSSGRLLLKLAEAELPEYAPHQRIELHGHGGGPVVVEQRGVSLADVAQVLRDAGALPDSTGAARDAVPGVAPVLAEPADD